MKKILLTLSILGATVLGLTTTKAAELDLNEVDTNTYIIGDRVYELNKYFLSIYDVVSATREYANNHDNKIAPIYYVGENGDGTKYLIEITGAAVDGVVPTEARDLETVFPGSIVHATALNNSPLNDFMKTEIEPKIIAAVNTLNAELKGSNYGFKAITYDAQTKTVIFDIEDYKALLTSYKDSSIIELFKANMIGAESVKYTAGTETIVLTKEQIESLTDDEIKGIAASILINMSNDLTLGSVAGKTTSAEVTFVDNNGYTVNETYNVTFKYDVETLKDKALTAVAENLNSELASHPEYGFKAITYNTSTNTVTFEIQNSDALLTAYKDSGIVDLFMENLKDATKIVYTAGEEISLNEEDIAGLDSNAVKGIAASILISMSNDLTLGSVIGKSATATVTYVDGSVITYTINFAA